MRKQTVFLVLPLLVAGLFMSCSKKNDLTPGGTPTVSVPIVGQWDINRVTIAGLPTSFTLAKNGTITANLGTDTYSFDSNGSFSNTYDNSNSTTTPRATITDQGMYTIRGNAVTLSVANQQPYTLTYTASANELTTGALPAGFITNNPTTNKRDTIRYTQEYVYKKR